MQESLLRIGALAACAEVSKRTVDFYTRLGLLSPAARSGGNFRLYRASDVQRIRVIRHLEAQGIRLEDVARVLSALPGRDVEGAEATTPPATPAALPQHLATLDTHVQALREIARNGNPRTNGVLATLVARAQALIATAVLLSEEILPGIDALPPH